MDFYTTLAARDWVTLERLLPEYVSDNQVIFDLINAQPPDSVIHRMVSLGFCFGTRDIWGNTVLHQHIRSRRCTPEGIRLLVESGCELDTKSNFGHTPLMYAIMNDRSLPNIAMLLKLGARLDETNLDGLTARVYTNIESRIYLNHVETCIILLVGQRRCNSTLHILFPDLIRRLTHYV
jgi:ankyrin repeat protein